MKHNSSITTHTVHTECICIQFGPCVKTCTMDGKPIDCNTLSKNDTIECKTFIDKLNMARESIDHFKQSLTTPTK